MNSIEISAKSISEAVELGAQKLGVGLDEVEYTVIDEGSKGFLGLGARLAKVKVKITGTEDEPTIEDTKKEAKEAKAEAKAEAKEAKAEAKKVAKEAKKEAKVEAKKESIIEPTNTEEKTHKQELTEDDKEKIVYIAKQFLRQVFDTMNIKVEIDAKMVDNKQLMIDMTGDDMGVIIGKRGQTLDSLQYLVNLVVNKGEYAYINVTLDTESYRQRRKETLETLAFNLAKKAKHLKKNVVLEPMNPYERRIIHSTLQNDRYVTTYSEGVEPFRYVVIAPKANYKKEN